jgi:hypothetical protein
MPLNYVVLIISWIIMAVAVIVPTMAGLYLGAAGIIIGITVGGIILYLCQDKIASFIKTGYPKTENDGASSK